MMAVRLADPSHKQSPLLQPRQQDWRTIARETSWCRLGNLQYLQQCLCQIYLQTVLLVRQETYFKINRSQLLQFE